MLVALCCSVVSVALAEPLFNLAPELKTNCPPRRCRPANVEGAEWSRVPSAVYRRPSQTTQTQR